MDKFDLLNIKDCNKINELISSCITGDIPTQQISIMFKEKNTFIDFDHYSKAEKYIEDMKKIFPNWVKETEAHIGTRNIYPNYMTNHALCWDIEHFIKKRGLEDKYLENLKWLCFGNIGIDLTKVNNLFTLVHTTTENKCMASLITALEC